LSLDGSLCTTLQKVANPAPQPDSLLTARLDNRRNRMTPGSLLCLCRLEGEQSATAMPVGLRQTLRGSLKNRADGTKGEKRDKFV
jgi:hypothetical protein